MLPHERKTASCFEALEAIHNRSQLDRRPLADEVQLRPQRKPLSCQATAGQQHGCHRACKQPKPAHSKAIRATMESPHSDHCPRRARHSQLNTTTSPASKAPAAPLPRSFSADALKAKIQRSARNLQAIPQGSQCTGSLIRRISEFLDHAKARAILTSYHNSTCRKFFWSACSRTCRLSSHNSTCPSSCPFRGKSFSVLRQTRWLPVVQESARSAVS